jgi:guanylate kinase
MEKQVLVTLTAPSCAGKSYLFNFIRDEAKLPCLISTTTRAPRAGEVDGVDYFFISEEESLRLEEAGEFAELAKFNGARYGVTKQEFHTKLAQGVAFLIVEPSGIEHYAAPAIEVGALHLKTYVSVDPALRLQRFKDRAAKDLEKAVIQNHEDYAALKAATFKAQFASLSRLETMLTVEKNWFQLCHWDVVLNGDAHPSENLKAILHNVDKLRRAA